MKKFEITCTVIYNGTVTVEAESMDDALDMVQESMDCESLAGFPDSVNVGDIRFTFGEATADYADETDD